MRKLLLVCVMLLCPTVVWAQGFGTAVVNNETNKYDKTYGGHVGYNPFPMPYPMPQPPHLPHPMPHPIPHPFPGGGYGG